VVRNGCHRPREILTSAGAVEVTVPRVNDKRTDPATGERRRFFSAIVPPWARRTPKITGVLPIPRLTGPRPSSPPSQSIPCALCAPPAPQASLAPKRRWARAAWMDQKTRPGVLFCPSTPTKIALGRRPLCRQQVAICPCAR
jgi:hypothetical protein